MYLSSRMAITSKRHSVTQLLHAESAEDLRNKLAAINVVVLPRSAGRTKVQVELFDMIHLLSSLPPDRFVFPLNVEHCDRPDFVMTFNGRPIGIELTEAVPENVARASVLRQSGLGPEVFFIPRALPGEQPKSTSELRREIELDKPGRPWLGNAPEHEWANAMLHCAKAKREKAKKAGFGRHPRNWLLIYDNWPLPEVRHSEASSLLAGKCAAEGIFDTFECLFVLNSNFLCQVSDSVEVHKVRSPGCGL